MGLVIMLLVLLAIYIGSGIKVVNQYERGIILTLGKYTGTKEPGLRIVWPGFQKWREWTFVQRRLMYQSKRSSLRIT